MKSKIMSLGAFALILTLSLGFLSAGASSESSAPIAENLEICTYRGVSVEGMLKATHPEGQAVSFKISTHPTKGELVLGDNGSFVYTPNEGKRGKDYFGYKAMDVNGNSSCEATVIIKIEKQAKSISYSDMDGNGAGAAAVALAEKNIFIGEQLGGQYVFRPEAKVSRSEFLAMCMRLSDIDILSGVITTGFGDDEDIPMYMKPYVSTALLTGIISGYTDGSHTAVFSGKNNISYPEAAVILNRCLGLSDVRVSGLDGSVPVWSVQACANLSACRISEYNEEQQLTRADCAKLLMNAMRVLESR
ncbi:MAG: hypothetical protein GX025_03870 [Clostridiales bacterium]|nr:hypothetical protein [Clostridiales bacterium]